MNLLDQVRIYKPNKASTHVSNAVSTWVYAGDAGGVLFILTQTTTGPASSGTVTVQQASALSTGAGIIPYAYSAKVILGSTNRIMAIDVAKPIKPYVRLRMLTCTGVQAIPVAYSLRRMGSTEARNIVNASSNQPSGVYVCTTSS